MQKLLIEPPPYWTYPPDRLPCDYNATNSYIPDHEYDIRKIGMWLICNLDTINIIIQNGAYKLGPKVFNHTMIGVIMISK